MLQKIFLGIFLSGIFCTGIFIGIISEKIFSSEEKSQEFSGENITKKQIPVLEFSKIENGILFGKNSGEEIRISIAHEDIRVVHNEEFFVDITKIFPMAKILPHPKDAKFVASKRGKKYWALDTPQAFLISSKNRKFFISEQEAKKAGYKRGK